MKASERYSSIIMVTCLTSKHVAPNTHIVIQNICQHRLETACITSHVQLQDVFIPSRKFGIALLLLIWRYVRGFVWWRYAIFFLKENVMKKLLKSNDMMKSMIKSIIPWYVTIWSLNCDYKYRKSLNQCSRSSKISLNK